MSRKDLQAGGNLTSATFNAQLAFLEELMHDDDNQILIGQKLENLALDLSRMSDKFLSGTIRELILEAAKVLAPTHPVQRHMILSLAESVKLARVHQRDCKVPHHLKSTEKR